MSDFDRYSTVDEIRERFDHDVERFSNLDAGQAAVIDSPLHLDLIARVAAAATPGARDLLDVGCGAGNYTLKLMQRLPLQRCMLLDLSRPMLDRAVQRVTAAGMPEVEAVQADIRDADLGGPRFDVIVAAQCLHHLRGEDEWRRVFAKLLAALTPGGSLWISDSIASTLPGVEDVIWDRWRDYLTDLDGPDYAAKVEAYVRKEDTPRPLVWQLDLLRDVGFEAVDVLHKHSRFASFGGVRA